MLHRTPIHLTGRAIVALPSPDLFRPDTAVNVAHHKQPDTLDVSCLCGKTFITVPTGTPFPDHRCHRKGCNP